MKLPGAILRYEGDVEVLVPIDPLGNGQNSKEAVTTRTIDWEVQESIMYADPEDTEWQQELESCGYYRLSREEARSGDVKELSLNDKDVIVMGRQELVYLNRVDGDEDFCSLSRKFPWTPDTSEPSSL